MNKSFEESEQYIKEESLRLKQIEAYFSFQEMLGISEIIGFKTLKKVTIKKEKPTPRIPLVLPNTLLELAEEIKAFNGCFLKRFAQSTVVGEGVLNAKIMIIGEAPGEEEDINGIPFCGRSGKLLEGAFNRFGIFREKNCYITNSVFWRPPANRKPEKTELEACRPFLERMIKIIKPHLIITAGSVAMQNAVGLEKNISDFRQKSFNFNFLHEEKEDIPVVTIYHPAYLLRSPSKKRDAYLDLLWLQRKYNLKALLI